MPILRRMKQRGFTLIEMLVTIAIVAIVAALATPAFRVFLVKRTVESALESLATDFRYARSEALKRGNFVTICRSSDGATCASSASANWKDGWIVFVDSDRDVAVDSGETILRVQSAPYLVGSIASTSPSSDKVGFTFYPTGWSKSGSQTFIITPSGSVPKGSTRLLCISTMGRPGTRAAGSAATCS